MIRSVRQGIRLIQITVGSNNLLYKSGLNPRESFTGFTVKIEPPRIFGLRLQNFKNEFSYIFIKLQKVLSNGLIKPRQISFFVLKE